MLLVEVGISLLFYRLNYTGFIGNNIKWVKLFKNVPN